MIWMNMEPSDGGFEKGEALSTVTKQKLWLHDLVQEEMQGTKYGAKWRRMI
jgi:hypothetical protein